MLRRCVRLNRFITHEKSCGAHPLIQHANPAIHVHRQLVLQQHLYVKCTGARSWLPVYLTYLRTRQRGTSHRCSGWPASALRCVMSLLRRQGVGGYWRSGPLTFDEQLLLNETTVSRLRPVARTKDIRGNIVSKHPRCAVSYRWNNLRPGCVE